MACNDYTLEQYQALIAAIAQGALEVQYGDKTVKYRSLAEMLHIKDLMKNCLFPETGVKNSGRILAGFRKGTC